MSETRKVRKRGTASRREREGAGGPGPAGTPFADVGEGPAPAGGDPQKNIELLKDVALRVKVELGRGRMALEDILRLGEGSVVELDRLAGDALDIYVNDRLIARGEVLVLDDNFCVRITEIIEPEACLEVTGK